MESKISQFVTVTGASEEDARSLLEACSGDLDMAVNMHLESKGGVVAETSHSCPVVDGKSYEELHGVRAPIPQTSGILLDERPSVSASFSFSDSVLSADTKLHPYFAFVLGSVVGEQVLDLLMERYAGYEVVAGPTSHLGTTVIFSQNVPTIDRCALIPSKHFFPPHMRDKQSATSIPTSLLDNWREVESWDTTQSMRSRRLPPTVFDPFQDYSRIAEKGGKSGKSKSLAELFKPPVDIMFAGTFEELRIAGQTKGRWLLVNVQDSKQFACQILNRDVWSHVGVRTILSKHFLFWQIHSITDDGLRFKHLYNVDIYPYVAILDPRTGEQMLHWSVITVTQFITELTEFLRNNAFDDDKGPSKDSRGLAEMTEDEQLQAAIKASLQETKPETRDFAQPNGDSDEFLSLCSGEEDETDACRASDMEHDAGKITSDTLLSPMYTATHSDADVCAMLTQETALFTSSARDRTTLPANDSLIDLQTRKRKCTADEEWYDIGVPSPKMPRSSIFQQASKLVPGDTSTMANSSEFCGNFQIQRKGKGSNLKGKHKATSVSVEEQLESGRLDKAEVSRIVIRLPNGTRLQKTFLCRSPIKELFTFLLEMGIDSSEHEILTNFPRRSLCNLDHFLTFRDADLYPSVTVFVQD